MAQAQTPQKQASVFPITAFTLPKTGKSRSVLANRFDHTVFVNVDMTGWSNEVLTSLLIEAIQTKARAAVKKLNQAEATEEQIQAAMNAKIAELKAGKGVAGKAKPKMSEEVKAIRAEARSILREAFRAQHMASGAEGEIDGKALTIKVSEMFKVRDTFTRNPNKAPKVKRGEHTIEFTLETAAKITTAVNNVLNTAAERIKQRTENADILGELGADLPTRAVKPKATAKPAAQGKGKGKATGKAASPGM